MNLVYSQQAKGELPPVFLSSFSQYRGSSKTAGASASYSASTRIIYVPFYLSRGATVYRYFWLNGSTVGTNNFQVGVYTTAFAAVNRGTSTLSANASVCQFDNITDYYLGPGRYYMAIWGSGTTANLYRIDANANIPQGIYYETNAGGLPSTGTPIDPATAISAYLPLFGLALRATDP